MFKIQAKIKNIEKFWKEIRTYDDRVEKAGINAVKIELYRLRTELQLYLISLPGGPPMKEISKLSREYQAAFGSKLWGKTAIPKPNRDDPALRAIAIPVRYETKKIGDKLRGRVGVTKDKSVSASWRKILFKQTEGFKVPLTDELREYFATFPPEIGEKPIFFREEKKYLNVPPRKIIGPFWRKQQGIAYANIKRNFDAKMAGKYV